MSSGKLHPIYVALDGHQYSRAVKLALSLPESNTLGKALLAHAYLKSGQKHAALVTLNKIVGGCCELSDELKMSSPVVNSPQLPIQKGELKGKMKGKSKKGKKKPVQVTTRESDIVATTKDESMMDRLDNQPSVPPNWEELPSLKAVITDETTLATLAVTLQSLKLPLTAYQIYAWAVSTAPSEEFLTKSFTLGLGVLASPSRWDKTSREKIETHILSQLQVVALQLARLVVQQGESVCSSRLATGWATQAALWQLQWLPYNEKRQLILPRLAESMALRLIQQEVGTNGSAEVRLLCHRILELQAKPADMLEILQQDSIPIAEAPSGSEFGVSLTAYQVQTMKAKLFTQIEDYSAARRIYEDLLAQNPDDWTCLQGHLDCCAKIESVDLTCSFVGKIIAQEGASKYPLRGPHLMKVELAAHFAQCDSNDASLRNLADAIITYGKTFGPRASCAFSDLESYIDVLLESRDVHDGAKVLVAFSIDLQKKHSLQSNVEESTKDDGEALSDLRAYIFAEKLIQKVLAFSKGYDCPSIANWTALLAEREISIAMSESDGTEEAEKEIKPGDELALLAINKLMYMNPEDTSAKITSAAILEKAIVYSPNNPYLKFAAMDIYHQLDATSLSWKIYKTLSLKHIQLDSCSFVILPYLVCGGLYNETIELCNSMIRFHTIAARDCGDYSGRAMKSGILSKADEFLVFQRTKMNRSLSMLEAKGLILDSAAVLGEPIERKRTEHEMMLHGKLGQLQGIVGGESDYDRAIQMTSEIFNPFASLSVISWAKSMERETDFGDITDNRDFSILSHRFRFSMPLDQKHSIIHGALRRGHIHGLLLRAAIFVDGIKGPKKGKVGGPNGELKRRTESFLRSVETVASLKLQSEEIASTGGKHLLSALAGICHALSVVGSGTPGLEKDGLEERELTASIILEERSLVHLKEAQKALRNSSVKAVCFTLPNYLVPLFSLFRMLAKVCDLFGWGKRKSKGRRCASSMASFAGQFCAMIEDFRSSMARLLLSSDGLSFEQELPPQYQNIFYDDIAKQTHRKIIEARKVTQLRVDPILEDMVDFLKSFEVSED
ncbi:unnamed protein product [Cylindrotheca closterium]|uniref:Uncharacterized protein n=1 Tax=Cylindrotheca closterium TaxID=2856 RepID=A0AAD2GA50_9STRA|nr:unnamed protein product [Cylindrotheca closterium]